MAIHNHIISAASYGSDLNAVNTARVSFGKESASFNERDKKLLKYLIKHKHWSPIWSQYLFFKLSLTEDSLKKLLFNKPHETFIIQDSDPSVVYLVVSVLGLKNLLDTPARFIAKQLINYVHSTSHKLENIFEALFTCLPEVKKKNNLYSLDRFPNKVFNLLNEDNLGSVELISKADFNPNCNLPETTGIASSNSPGYLKWYRFRVTAPIFVLRQLVKHRFGLSYNEISMRYVDSSGQDFYAPSKFRKQSENNKQASTDETVNPEVLKYYPDIAIDSKFTLSEAYDYKLKDMMDFYEVMLKEGVAREQARAVLPVAYHSTVLLTISKPALDNLVSLRTHEGAQYETRLFAEAMREAIYA